MSNSPTNHQKPTLREVEKLIQMFRPERMVLMAITITSTVFLLVCAGFLMFRENYVMAIGLFGSTGALTYTTGRLLSMWQDVLRILYGEQKALSSEGASDDGN